MIFSSGIKGMGYAPDYDEEEDEDFLDELYDQQEEEAMERYYEEKYNK